MTMRSGSWQRMAGTTTIAVALGVSALLGRQEIPPTFRGSVDVVQIDVSVVDRHHQPVTGLRASDFAVREDGDVRAIVAFSAVEVPVRDATGAAWLHEVRPDVSSNDLSARRLVAIVMDDATGRTEPVIAESARRIAHQVIDAMGAADLGAVVFTAGLASQNFTDDRARLRTVVDRFSIGPATATSGACPDRQCAWRTIEQVAETLQSVPGQRKLIFYVSTNGLGGSGAPGLQRVLRTAGASNVAVYPVDPSGLDDTSRLPGTRDPAAARRALQARQDGLRLLADGTGGRAILNTNDPSDQLQSVFTENRAYYLLGVRRVSTPSDTAVHRLDVTVNRRDVVVNARRRYVASPQLPVATAASSGDVPPDLRQVLARPMPANAVFLTMTAAPIATPDLRAGTVVIASGVRQVVTADLASEEIQTAVVAFDTAGRGQGWRQETMHLSLPVDVDGVARYEVLSRLELPPGRYEVRLALSRRSGGPPGSVHAFVDVPDFAAIPLTMSGLLLESTAAPVAAPLSVLEGVVPLVPTTLREFNAADQAHVFARVYQGRVSPALTVRLTGRVVDADGRIAFEQATTLDSAVFSETRAGEGVFELPIATLRPGPYLLRVEATTGNGSVARDLRFLVR